MGERNERVFSLLNKQNKTKAAMAQALGVSRSAISQWEKNGTEPTYEQCIILSNFLNVASLDDEFMVLCLFFNSPKIVLSNFFTS